MDGRQCTYTERKYTYPYGPEMIKVRATEGKGYLTIKAAGSQRLILELWKRLMRIPGASG